MWIVGLIFLVLAVAFWVLGSREETEEQGQAMPAGGCLLKLVALFFMVLGIAFVV